MHYKFKEKNRQIIGLDIGNIPERLIAKYLDMYDGVRSEVSHATNVMRIQT